MRTISTCDPALARESGAHVGFDSPNPGRYGGEDGAEWVGAAGMTLDVQSDAADA